VPVNLNILVTVIRGLQTGPAKTTGEYLENGIKGFDYNSVICEELHSKHNCTGERQMHKRLNG
jgi:hypothetical protein